MLTASGNNLKKLTNVEQKIVEQKNMESKFAHLP